ncbi:MAG: S8 family serine peptidase [bacterium]
MSKLSYCIFRVKDMIHTLGLEGDIPTSATYQRSLIKTMLIKDLIRYVTNQFSAFLNQEPTFGQAYLQAFMNDPVINPLILSFSATTDQAGEYAPVQPQIAVLVQTILREARNISVPQGASKFVDPSMQQALVDYIKSHQSMLKTIFGAKIFGQQSNTSQDDVTPNDTYFSNQWNLTQISAPNAWDLVFGNSTTYTVVATPTIAIVDTGVNLSQEDLKAKLVPGYDAVGASGGAADCQNSGNPYDENGHGTSVAGIAAASTNNSLGVAGVSWNAKIMPIRVDSYYTGFASDSEIISAYAYAVKNGAWILNNSWGGGSPSGVAALILSLNPNLTSAQVKQILENSADKVAGMNGNNYTTSYGYGRLNAYHAVQSALSSDTPSISLNTSSSNFSVAEPPSKRTWVPYDIYNNGNGPGKLVLYGTTNSGIGWYYPDFENVIIASGMEAIPSAWFDASVDGLPSITTEFKDSGTLNITETKTNQKQSIPGNIDVSLNATCSGCCCSMEPGVGINSLYSSLYPLLLILGAWIILKEKQKRRVK